jgi:hypothetical protein
VQAVAQAHADLAHPQPTSWYIAIVALILTPLQTILAILSARREWLYGQLIAAILFLAQIPLIGVGLYRMWHPDQLILLAYRERMTIYAGLAIPLLVMTVGFAYVCARNFNRGLKPLLWKSRVPADAAKDEASLREGHTFVQESDQRLDYLSSRMEID